MKLSELKIGDSIKHYCSGVIVTGEVIETGKDFVVTKHDPVNWGSDIYTNTRIMESSYLQKKWGGTDKHGLPSKGPATTPGAWFEGKELTV